MDRWYIHAALYIVIAILALLIIKIAIDPESNDVKKIQSKSTEIQIDYSEYENTLIRLFRLNVGDYFTKDNLNSFACNKENYYQVWVDIKSQDIYSSLYEIKGSDDVTSQGARITWRFYIKTENDIIVSITKI